MHYRVCICVLSLAMVSIAVGQEADSESSEPPPPEIAARGVRPGITLRSVPAVAQGGVLAVFGTDLATEHTPAGSDPLPLALGDPAVEVLINGSPVPIFFVSPTQVNVQVPWIAEPGLASVSLRRGGIEGNVRSVQITQSTPELFTHPGTRSLVLMGGEDGPQVIGPQLDGTVGETNGDVVVGIAAGQEVTIFAAGLGAPDTPPEVGSLGPGLAPAAPQRAYLDGLPLTIKSAQLSDTSVGVYELTFEIPPGAGSGGVLSWFSGNSVGRALLGQPDAPEPRYMDVPAELESPSRVDLSRLSPNAVALSGPLDVDGDFCYSGVQLLDFQQETTAALEQCLLPSFPLSPNQLNYRPFEAANGSTVLAALAVPLGDVGDAQSNLLVLVDTASLGDPQVVELEDPVDRLLPGFGNDSHLRLERPAGAGTYLVTTAGDVAGEGFSNTPLPNPLQVGELSVVVAQPVNISGFGGYRMRFLGPGPDAEESAPTVVLFDPRAEVVFQASYPDGWAPISPPRRINNRGLVMGNSISPSAAGFQSSTSVFGVVRSTDGMRDGVVTFRVMLPQPAEESELDDSEDPADEDTGPSFPDSIPVEVSVTPFPEGSFAANCHPEVRWLPISLTGTLAMVAAREVLDEFAIPQDNNMCTGDHLILLDVQSGELRTVEAPGLLEQGAKGAMNSYLYFADGDREVALEAPDRVYVFDGATETFAAVALPEDTGITLSNPIHVQRLPASNRIVALATGGPSRTNQRGVSLPPFPGNRGLMVVDLEAATAQNLPLPDGFRNAQLGPSFLFRQGRRTFGLQPLLGRAFGVLREQGGQPGNPPGSRLVFWDLASGTSETVAMPEGGSAVAYPTVQGQASPLWDYEPGSGAIGYGVLDSGRAQAQVVAIGVVSP